MMKGESQEFKNFPDPFWLEHGGKIRQVRQIIKTPKTHAGEEIQRDALNNQIFRVYPRLGPIFGCLVTLLEYDEIGKREGLNYFSQPKNQRIVLKALEMLVEDEIKYPYSPEEKKIYEDYKDFFEGIIARFRVLDKEIQSGQPPPNFVNTMVEVFADEVKKLKGVSGSGIHIERIRKKIAEWLPELEKIDEGELLSTIKNEMSQVLSSNS